MEGIWISLLSLLGIDLTPEGNIRAAATGLKNLQLADFSSQWFLDTYARGPGPIAVMLSLIVATFVLGQQVRSSGSFIGIGRAVLIYPETLIAYVLIITANQFLVETLGRLRSDLAGSVLSEANTTNLTRILTAVDPSAGWTKMFNWAATASIVAFANIIQYAMYLMAILLIVVWPLRHIGAARRPFTSIMTWTCVIQLTPIAMLCVLWFAAKSLNPEGGTVGLGRNIALTFFLVLTAFSPLVIKKWLTPNDAISTIANRVSVGGNVNANFNGPVPIRERLRSVSPRAMSERFISNHVHQEMLSTALASKAAAAKAAASSVPYVGTALAASIAVGQFIHKRRQASKASSTPPTSTPSAPPPASP